MRRLQGILVLIALAVAGCVDAPLPEEPAKAPAADGWLDGVTWDTTGPFSRPLTTGPYDMMPVELAEVVAHDGTSIATAVWRPDVPRDVRVPVLIDAGPYYAPGLGDIEGGHDEGIWRDRFVPHGYAYARVALRGTSDSGGCMEYHSVNDQRDLDAVLTHFGEAAWSNGRVGMLGKSYDGTTPWMAAATGNPHLATIVPVSGITSVRDWMYPNGTSRAYGVETHWRYWFYEGFEPTEPGARTAHWPENLCTETARGLAEAVAPTATGRTGAVDDAYWRERDWRSAVREHYAGSVFLIHGFEDGIVPPSQAFPFVSELAADGVDVKVLLGQWGHAYPDWGAPPSSFRWDHGEVLLRWFDHHLKGLDVPTGPAVDVQDSAGLWRVEEAWPPRDAAWTRLHLGEEGLTPEPQPEGSRVTSPGQVEGVPAAERWFFATAPLDVDLRFSGMARLHLTVTSFVPRGDVIAQLVDVAPDGATASLATAYMNLQYRGGGVEAQDVPVGERMLLPLQFEPADVIVGAGHRLEVRIVPVLKPPSLGAGPPVPMVLHWGDDLSVLDLPVIDRSDVAGTYPGQPSTAP